LSFTTRGAKQKRSPQISADERVIETLREIVGWHWCPDRMIFGYYQPAKLATFF
jgi:hypothetical protein